MNYSQRKLKAIGSVNRNTERRMLREFFSAWAVGYFAAPVLVAAALIISENADAIDNWILKVIEKVLL